MVIHKVHGNNLPRKYREDSISLPHGRKDAQKNNQFAQRSTTDHGIQLSIIKVVAKDLSLSITSGYKIISKR